MQLIYGTCLACALIPTFLWLKVPFGLLFGLTIGIMALVPFGGTVGIVLTTLLVALQDFWLGSRVLIASLLVQQFFENLVAPRILGSFTGLNPVWILISILTGARVAGLLGVIVAVPTAVVIKTALSAVRQTRSVPEGEPSVSDRELPAAEPSSTQSRAPDPPGNVKRITSPEKEELRPDSPAIEVVPKALDDIPPESSYQV